MDDDDKKPEDKPPEPAPDAAQEEAAQLREVSSDELKQILSYGLRREAIADKKTKH